VPLAATPPWFENQGYISAEFCTPIVIATVGFAVLLRETGLRAVDCWIDFSKDLEAT
jgi:hypothetical protein